MTKRDCMFCQAHLKPADGVVGIQITITPPNDAASSVVIGYAHRACAVVAMAKRQGVLGKFVASPPSAA